MEKHFGQFSKIFDALISHKVVVIVIASFFTSINVSSEVRLSRICLCCLLLLDLSMFLVLF